MTFYHKQLNQVYGSTSQSNLWVYDRKETNTVPADQVDPPAANQLDAETTTEMFVDDYFKPAFDEYGMKDGDTLILVGSDATTIKRIIDNAGVIEVRALI